MAKLKTNIQKSLKTNESESNFSPFSQGNVINPVFEKTGKNSKDEVQTLPAVGNKSAEYFLDLGDINLHSSGEGNLPMSLEDKKLFAQLIKEFTKKNQYKTDDMNLVDKNRYFDYPVESFFDVAGYSYTENNKKNVARLLKQSIEHLASYRIEVKEKAIKKAKNKEITIEDFGSIPLLGYVGTRVVTTQDKLDKKTIKIEKGFIRLALSMELAKYLNLSPVGIIPDEITTTKNPVTFYLGYDLAVHYNTNTLHKHSNATIRKVKSLIEDCMDLPSVEYIQKTSRKYFEYIMKPFCQGLAELQSFDISIVKKNEETGEYDLIQHIEPGTKDFNWCKGLNIEIFTSYYVQFFPKVSGQLPDAESRIEQLDLFE
ncbi:MAG: hypothetical protein HUK25_10775 [Treponema sp.]|nr:hypothetical protein [Treponema sp.]